MDMPDFDATASTTSTTTSAVNVSPTRPANAINSQLLVRRQQNVKVVGTGLFICGGFLIPATLYPAYDSAGFSAAVSAVLLALAALLLNHRGSVNVAARVLVLGTFIPLVFYIFALGYFEGGLDLSELRMLDLFTVPIIIVALVGMQNDPFKLAALTSLTTVVALVVLPRTPMLELYYQQQYGYARGSMYDVFVIPVALQWCVATIGWVASRTVSLALKNIVRADELTVSAAQAQLRSDMLEYHQNRLREGMKRVQAVYAAFTRGQTDVRVQAPDKDLLPLALSFNLLLDRLTREKSEIQARERTLAQVRDVTNAQRARRLGLPEYWPGVSDHLIEDLKSEILANLENVPPERTMPSGHTTAPRNTTNDSTQLVF